MKLVFADETLIEQLVAIATGSGGGLYWRLFENDVVPSADMVKADYTLSDDAWGEIQVAPGDFDIQQVSAGQGSIQALNIVFQNGSGGPLNFYGYVILNAAKTKVIAAARFDDAPISLADFGKLPVVPILGAQSYYPDGA